MNQYQTGLMLLAFAALFAFVAWRNHKSGLAIGNWAVRADRGTHPVGFWIIQAMWVTLAVMLAVGGLSVLFGIAPV
ncbi:MAG: hypothetical protein R3C27_10395 [Hyphomonadaceae bacterium]